MEARTRAPNAREVLGAGGLVARVHSGWEARAGQIAMAEAVAERIARGGVVAVEAPTGIGKTLAYLVPAILSGKRVIVSTNTKTLQDQIVGKDLPLLASALKLEGIELVRAEPGPRGLFEQQTPKRAYAVMKGRSNYLCWDRLDRRRRQERLAFMDTRVLDRIAKWSAKTIRGDRAELEGVADDAPEWGEVDARAETCIGQRCTKWEQCFVVRMRREAQNAELIVVNHHLLLADLALRAEASLAGEGRAFGEVIPQSDALIVDEAHALEETASEYFGGEISTRKLARFTQDALAWTAQRTGDEAFTMGTIVTDAIARAEGVFDKIPASDERLRLPPPSDGDEYEGLRSAARDAEAALQALSGRFEAMPWDAAAESLGRRARAMADAVRFIAKASDPDFVYWAERRGKHARMGAAPIEVADLLSQFLFGTFKSVVLTSATLTTAASEPRDAFEYFLRRVGAPGNAERLGLETPFDYQRQAALYVPPQLPAPDHPRAADALAETGKTLIDLVGGGAFFLFTSHRMMREVCFRLRKTLNYPVLLQGEAPKAALIREFVRRAPAVLFATASFWEGVDVPGDPLRLVLIDRLPFASPGDPVVAARLERIEQRGESPFAAYQIPQAILRLKQGFGRLVRSRNDRGVVAILDRRLREKAYGARFLEALPAAERIDRWEDLQRWWSRDVPLEPIGSREKVEV